MQVAGGAKKHIDQQAPTNKAEIDENIKENWQFDRNTSQVILDILQADEPRPVPPEGILVAGFRKKADDYLWHVGLTKHGQKYANLEVYVTALRGCKGATKADFDGLVKIAEDCEEPVLFRSKAWQGLGVFWLHKGDQHESAECYRRALNSIQSATAREKNRVIRGSLGDNPQKGRRRVETLLGDTKMELEADLTRMKTTARPASVANALEVRFEFHDMLKGATFPEFCCHVPATRPDLAERIRVGGFACDCCGKSQEELGQIQMKCCLKCNMAHYCSTDCEEASWKAGHQQACRPVGKIQAGDIMQLVPSKSLKPELNGELVTIVEADLQKKSHWIAELLVGELAVMHDMVGPMRIKASKMLHIRPAK
ncbi:expressed unknown protein [Seminavis robusta]|uniref:MYND-type domain-containing protein n=1 Tax=Seminavis robusta TaxID=568900 RepID=A0A9N8DZP0_9STRA|nr:expressed unknown protein [Seminavis robusta]|eukprot:Sro506_g156380.1 n/a (369) ;mRNA; r:52332-53438